jgi:hypothetical protein
VSRQIAGARGRNGLGEAARRQREWDERPIPWWDADRHIARQHEEWGRPLVADAQDCD